MPFLIDTNVFLRLVPDSELERTVVLSALRKFRASNESLYYSVSRLRVVRLRGRRRTTLRKV
jgi:hypothetical protein